MYFRLLYHCFAIDSAWLHCFIPQKLTNFNQWITEKSRNNGGNSFYVSCL